MNVKYAQRVGRLDPDPITPQKETPSWAQQEIPPQGDPACSHQILFSLWEVNMSLLLIYMF